MAIKYESGASTALNDYKGWKINTKDATIKFLVEKNSQVKVAIGRDNTAAVSYTALNGTAMNNVNQEKSTEVTYSVKAGTMFTISMTTGSTITLKGISISPLYDATLTDTKSDGSASKPSVAEVTLPTPTAVSGWMFTGWVANADVKAGEDTKTAGTVLAAGTYTLLDNTTFTAQWVQLYAVTYDNNGGDGIMTDSNSPYAEGAEVTLLDNTFTAPTNKIFGSWVATYNDGTEKTLTITNGKFTMPAYNVTVTAQWVDDNKVAKIGETYYTSLEGAEGAFANVADGQTIELLKNCDVTSQLEIAAGVTATIDLNGYKIEYTGSTTLPSGVILVHNGASLTINDSSEPSTGKVFAGTKAYAAVALTKLGDDASTPATLVVNGGALTGYYYGITGNGSRNNTVITINGGTITGTVGIAIYHPQVGTLTVNNGSLTGVDAAIEMRAGTLVINDGTFTATATEFSCNPNGSGSTTTGAAIAIAQHTTKKDIEVTINGGTFNGVKALNESNPQVNDPAPQVTMAVTAGTFTGEVTTVDVNNFISGGTFDHEVAANQCAEGYAPKDNGDNTYGVKPLAQTFSLEDLVTAQGTSANYTTYLNNLGWTVANADALDNLNTDKDYDNYPYLGLKFKNAAGYVAGEVEGGKLLTIKLGHMAGVAHLMVDDVKKMELDGVDAETPKVHYYYVENTANVKLLMANAGSKQTCVLKAITVADPFTVTFDANGGEAVASQNGTPSITLPSATKGSEVFKGWYDAAEGGNLIGKANESYTPTADVTLYAQWEAVSSDATLSALEVDGATVAGFDPETYIYNIVCEYGHTPQITTATAAAQGAAVTIYNEPVDGVGYKYVQVKVVPASGEEGKKFYQVRYTNKPKQGVTLIKATHDGTATGATVTGYLGGTYDKNTASDGKLGGANTYFGIKLAEGNFQAGDVLYIHASTVSSAVRIYSDKGTTRINAEDGTFDANKMFTYTLTAETEWIYIYRKVKDGESDMNPYVDYIEVQRHMAPFIESFEIEGIGALNINPTTKAITASVPESFDVTALTPTIKAWANGSAHLDKSGAKDFTNPVTYTVTSDYAEDGEVTYTVTITKVAPSATPVIATQPAGDSYVEGASVEVLTVAAEPTAGTLSYQWQVKNGEEWENIDGATAASYTPAVSAIGSYTYRVVVTNTEESKPATSVNSNEATIVITADPSCATFAGEIADPTYEYTNSGVWTIYNASSSGKYNESHVFDTGKNFENENVNVYKKERCVMIFEKDMKQVRFYSTGNTRDWATENAVQVSEDKANFLAKKSLTYSTMAATTSMDNSYAADGKSCVLIANGDFEAGKVYWFAFNGTLQVSRICAVEADPKAEAPVFNGALSDEAICPGANFTTLDATASPVTSYAWYKDGVVIDGAEAATYTPTEEGTYYCIATNAQAGHRPNSLKSAEAVLSVNEAASVTMANISGKATASIALNAVATGANPHYAWYTCDDAEGTNAEPIPGATDAASYAIPTPVATQYYKVVVTTDCGTVSAVALVTLLPDIVPLADVTENTVWDWAEITARADGSAIDEVIDNKPYGPHVATANGLVLANYVLGGVYWDKIEGNNGAYSIRNSSNKFYQGASLHMHTTKGGILTIRARNEGHAMTLKVENEGRDMNLGALDNWKNYTIYVKAGDVTIYNVPAEGTYPMRVEKITFTVKESPDYPRDVTNNIGTLCVDHNVVAGGALGATFYQIASRNETYPDKIDFEEVMPGEELKAGEPYIFKSNTGKIELYYGETVADGPVAVRGMHGVLTDGGSIAITEENKRNILYISQNDLYNCTNLTSLSLVKNRAYIVMSEVPTYAEYQASQSNSQSNNARRRVTLSMNGTNSATDIDNIFGNDTKAEKVLINGQLFILRGGKMFDATGRLVK